MPSMKVIVPKSLVVDPQKLARAVANGLDGAAKGATVDFKTTTATWQHTVSFETTEPDAARRVVGTDDEIYGYVNAGTRPHVIVAHGKALAFGVGGRPKSRPGYIGANAGSTGKGTVFRRMVNHPGTTARGFDTAIATKWQEQLPIIMQRAIDSEV